jgi:DNA-directed RNA polymerase specialized sigma24 family protein
MDVTTNFRLHRFEDIQISDPLREQSVLFEARFSRCREMLCFLACRVVGNPEQAQIVVRNCKITASRNPPTFEYEGAFRSWLARILIDEGLAIVHRQNSDVTNSGTSPDWRNK